MTKKQRNELVKQVYKRSSAVRELDDLDQSPSTSGNAFDEAGKQVSDVRVAENDFNGYENAEAHAVEHSNALGSSSQGFDQQFDEEMEGMDWEDGSQQISIAKSQAGDHSSEIIVELDESQPISLHKKVVRRATAEEKEVAELVHKAHLLCLLARGRIIDKTCDDPLIQASLLSLLPVHLLRISKASNLIAAALNPLVRWINANFYVSSSPRDTTLFRASLFAAIEHRRGTSEEIAALSVALFRALGFTTRFVSVLDVASIKPNAETLLPFSCHVKKHGRSIFENVTPMVDTTTDLFREVKPANEIFQKCCSTAKSFKSKGSPANLNSDDQILDFSPSQGCSASINVKRKGDMEFEMQLQMAISATAAATPQSIDTDIPNFPDTVKVRKTLPQGVSTAVGSRKVGSPLFWAEVYCNGESVSGRWVHVDPVNAIVNGEDKVDAAVSACRKMLRYAVAFAGNGAKDVTRRYCIKWCNIASQRTTSRWWDAVLAPLRELESAATNEGNPVTGNSGENHFTCTRSSLEDVELDTRALTEPLPSNQQAYRNHQLYAIERWLTKTQMLRPRGPVLGFCSGHPVFPRSCVQTLRTKHRWLREALQVKPDEIPAKVIKQSKKLKKVEFLEEMDDDGEDDNGGSVELYGRWQVEPLQLPPAVNGIVPKNERGQVDVWSEKCLPPGTAHIRLPKAFLIAKRLEVDYAPAMVGFDFRNGKAVPVYDGIVVCCEFKDLIVEAFAEEDSRRQAEERRRNEAQALSRWYQLLSSIITRHRLRNTYGENRTPPVAAVPRGSASDDAPASSGNKRKREREDRLGMRSVFVEGEGHEHLFLEEDESYDAETSVKTKRCRCGFSVHVEEL